LFGGILDVTRRLRLTTFRRNEPHWPTRSVEHGAINFGRDHCSFACTMRLFVFICSSAKPPNAGGERLEKNVSFFPVRSTAWFGATRVSSASLPPTR